MNAAKILAIGLTANALLLNSPSAHAVPVPQPQPRTVAAPPLQEGKVTATSDLGLWDDVFVAHNQDIILLRRADEFFSLSMETSAKPRKIAEAAAANNTQIVAGMAVDDKFWLFLNSRKAAPCAIDAYSGTVAAFEIPGLKVPGSHAPGIQSYHIVPHTQAALLMVSGGDRATWPRDGNRPIYFWMDLKSAKVVRLPIGWDLDYYSADERVAVFAPTRAIAMKTGELLEATPNRRKERYIPYDWTNTQKIRPLYERREGKGDADYFAGVTVEGLVLPVALGLEEVLYLSMAKADDHFAGFRLRRSGNSRGEPSPLWIVPFKDTKKTEPIATEVTDFTMLGQGNTVYVSVEKGVRPARLENRSYGEAFFYARADRSTWNVLEGVERLPKLERAFADASFVHDSLKVNLIEGFGTRRHEPLVICLFEQHRADLRARVLPTDGKSLESVTWRRALLISHDGKRSLTPHFRDGNLPDQIWLHKSGKLILGTYGWKNSDQGRIRQIRLSAITLPKP